jgi:hypothetical protein
MDIIAEILSWYVKVLETIDQTTLGVALAVFSAGIGLLKFKVPMAKSTKILFGLYTRDESVETFPYAFFGYFLLVVSALIFLWGAFVERDNSKQVKTREVKSHKKPTVLIYKANEGKRKTPIRKMIKPVSRVLVRRVKVKVVKKKTVVMPEIKHSKVKARDMKKTAAALEKPKIAKPQSKKIILERLKAQYLSCTKVQRKYFRKKLIEFAIQQEEYFSLKKVVIFFKEGKKWFSGEIETAILRLNEKDFSLFLSKKEFPKSIECKDPFVRKFVVQFFSKQLPLIQKLRASKLYEKK